MKNFLDDCERTIFRFPLVTVNNILSTVISIFLIFKAPYSNHFPLLEKSLLCFLLGFPLLISSQLFAENFKFNFLKKILLNFLSVGFLIFYFFVLPRGFDDFLFSDALQFLLILLGFSLSVFFTPFCGKKNSTNELWEFDKKLLLNFATAFFFGLAVFIAAVLCLVAIYFLFHVSDDEFFMSSFAICAQIISPMIFLVKFPQNFSAKIKPSKILNHFGNFVLLPFLTCYSVILIIYFLKIIITQYWPIGELSSFILVFLLTLFLANFIFFPQAGEKKWVKIFRQISFVIVFPMVVMLFVAVFWRVKYFGWTENRVLLFIFGLLFLMITFQFFRKKNLKSVFAISFFAIAITSVFIFPFCRWHQASRLEKVLASEGFLQHGKIVKDTSHKNFQSISKISGISEYLIEYHGVKSLQKFLTSEDFNKLKTLNDNYDGDYNVDYYDETSFFVENILGQNFIPSWQRSNYKNENNQLEDNLETVVKRNFYRKDYFNQNSVYDVTGFDFIAHFSTSYQEKIEIPEEYNQKMNFYLDDNLILQFFVNGQKISEFNLEKISENLSSDDNKNKNTDMTFENENMKIIFDTIYYQENYNSGKKTDPDCSGRIFWKKNKN